LHSIVNPDIVSETDTTIVISDNDVKTVKALNELREIIKKDGQVELDLKIPEVEDNFKSTDPNEAPIGVYYKNVLIGYINRVSSIEKEINRLESDGNSNAALARRVNLLETVKIRTAFAKNKNSKILLKKVSAGARKKTGNNQLSLLSRIAKAMSVRLYHIPEDGGSVVSSTLSPLIGEGQAYDTKSISATYNEDMLYSSSNVFVLVPASPNLSIDFTDYDDTQTAIPLYISGNKLDSESITDVIKLLNQLIKGLKTGLSPFKDDSMIEIKKAINRITLFRSNVRDAKDNLYAPTFLVHGPNANSKGRIEILNGDYTELYTIYVAPNDEIRLTKRVWTGKKTKYESYEEYNSNVGNKIPINGKDILVLNDANRKVFSDTLKDVLSGKRYNLYLEAGREQELHDSILNSDRFGINIKTTEDSEGNILSLFGGKIAANNGVDNVNTRVVLKTWSDESKTEVSEAKNVKKDKVSDTVLNPLPVEEESLANSDLSQVDVITSIDPNSIQDSDDSDLTDLLTDALFFKASTNSTKDELIESNQSQIENFQNILGDEIPIEILPEQLMDNGDVVYGVFRKAAVTLSKYSIVGTEYHEAFHAIFNMYLNESDRLNLLEEANKKYGLEEDLLTEDSKLRVEEFLAEKFRSFMLTKQVGKEPQGFSGKVKAFFDKLYRMLQTYFGKIDRIDLLFESASRGDFKNSAKMNYPNQDILRFSKAPTGQALPDAFAIFKPDEQLKYIQYGGLISMRFIKAYGDKYKSAITPEMIESGEVPTLKNQFKLTLAKNLIGKDEDSIAYKTTTYLMNLLDSNDNTYWSKVVEYVKNNLKVDVSSDENIDTSALTRQQMSKLWDDASQTKVSSKATVDFELKRFLMTTEKISSFKFTFDASGNPIFSFVPSKDNLAELPEVENFSIIYSSLSTQLADSIDIDEMMSKILELAKLNPSFALIYQRLKTDEEYQEKLFTAFNKPKVNSIQLTHTTDKTLALRVPTISYRLTNSMADAVKVVVESYNSNKGKSLITSAKIQKFREWNIKVRQALIKSKDRVDSATKKDMLSMLRALGITITKPQLDLALDAVGNTTYFEKSEVKTRTKPEIAERIRAAIFKLGEELFNQTLIHDKITFDEQGRVGEIAAFFEEVFLDLKEPSFYNAERTLQYALQKPLFINKFFSRLAQVFNKRTINKMNAYNTIVDMVQTYLQDNALKYSNWLNAIVDFKTMDLKDNNAKNFKFYWFNGITDADTFTGKMYDGVTDLDWSASKLALYLKEKAYGYYSLPTLSDSSNQAVIKAPKYNGIVNGELIDNTPLKNALLNIIYHDLRKADNARLLLFADTAILSDEVKDQLLVNHHYKSVDDNNNPIIIDADGLPTGQVFQTLSLTYTEKGKVRKISDIIGLDEKDQLVFKGEESKLAFPLSIFYNGVYDTSTLSPNKRRLLDKFINNFVKVEVAQSFNLYSAIASDLKEDVKKSSYSNESDMIHEFVLNNFIAQQEIASLFNGNNSEYKGITDHNKRSKQLISPTQYLSTKHRGKRSKYIVVPDVIITPDTLEPNSVNLAKALQVSNKKYTSLSYDHSVAFGSGIKNALEQDVYNKMSPYLSVNSTDGQGFITLDFFEKYLQDRGIRGKTMQKLIADLRAGRDYNDKYLKEVLQVLKPYYANRSYNSVTNTMENVQIKTSVQILIPGLIKGTVLEQLLAVAPKDLSHIYTRSAVKVGNKRVSTVSLENLSSNELTIANLNVLELDNEQWGVQLDVSEHLKDTTNPLSIQAKKVLFSNIPDAVEFDIKGNTFTGKELHEKIQSVFSELSTKGTNELIKSISDPKNVAVILEDYMNKNNLPHHYKALLKINEAGDNFVISLAIPSFSNKFQSLLISLFIQKGIKIPIAGGHATLLSDSFISSFIDTDSIDTTSFTTEIVERIKATGKINLKQSIVSDGKSKYIETECLLPAWTSKFFENGQRININELPEEARNILGHRTPLEGKYSFLSLKVVGFLPEAVGSTIVLPAALVAQTGHDFDVDSEHLLFQYLDKENNPIKYNLAKPVKDWDNKELNNFIFDSYKAILEHPSQIEEHIVPSSMEEVKVVIREQKKLLNIAEDGQNHNSLAAQDKLRSTNMMGTHLKGIAAVYNSMIPIVQKLKLATTELIGVSYDLSKYDLKDLQDKYGQVAVEGNKATINHKQFGWNNQDFTDPNGDLISIGLAKTLANVLDIVKEGTLLNLNLATASNYMLMRTLGIPLKEASLLLIQPVIMRAYNASQNAMIYKGKAIEPIKAYMKALKDISKQTNTPYVAYKDIPAVDLNSAEMEAAILYFKNEKPKSFAKASLAELQKARDQYLYQLGLYKTWNRLTKINYDYKKVMDGTTLDRTKATNIPELFKSIDSYDSLNASDSTVYSMYGDEARDVRTVLDTTDAYKSIKTYRNNMEAYLKVLDKYFLDLKGEVLTAANTYGPKYSPEVHKKIVEVASFSLLRNDMTDVEISRILKAVPNTNTKMDIDEFKQLSTANKLWFIKYKLRESISETNILYHLSPKISEGDFNLKSFYEIKFDKPHLSDGLDTYLTDSFAALLNSNSEFLKDLGEDLIKYNYITQGFAFSGNSFGNYIPVTELLTRGWLDGLQQASKFGLTELEITYEGLIDLAGRNGWKDPKLSKINFINKNTLPEGDAFRDINGMNTFSLSKAKKKELGFNPNFYTFIIKDGNTTEIIQTSVAKVDDVFWFTPVNRLSNGYIKTESGQFSVIPEQNAFFSYMNQYSGNIEDIGDSSRLDSYDEDAVTC